MSKSFLPMFFSKSFIVSSLMFRSVIHFVFVYVYGVECSNFIFLHISVQLSLYLLIDKIFFSPLYIFASFIMD